MTTDAPRNLEELIRLSGEGWLIDWYLPKEAALPHLRSLLQRADERLRQRCPNAGYRIDEQTLLAEYRKSPHKVRAFLQAAGETVSPDMLVMAWRLLQGAEVAEVELQYQLQKRFGLRVKVTSPEGQPEEIYESSDIDDAAVFRHFGILKMDDHPVFDGFYALQR